MRTDLIEISIRLTHDPVPRTRDDEPSIDPPAPAFAPAVIRTAPMNNCGCGSIFCGDRAGE